MSNNDILRRVRNLFDLNDSLTIRLISNDDFELSRDELLTWAKNEEDEGYEEMEDYYLAALLNGLIELKRGKREGPPIKTENRLNNNIIFRKLKIALDFKDEDILETLELVERKFSKHELSAFFRNPNQPQYRECGDQVLRNFLQGLKIRKQMNK